MLDHQNWLAEYAQTGSDAAFRELATRYVDLVYSTALRLLGGDAHRAEDVTQTVFVNLARAARTLPKNVKLGGWLHRDTCFTAATLMRGERRRQARERQAVEMNALQNDPAADYSLVAPVLDDAINELDDDDRIAILLRFFEQNDFRSIGAVLDSTEDAARMRVTRALEKLEGFLKRRGVTSTAASLGVVLSANAVQAAPAGLALAISTTAALTGTTLATSVTVAATKAIAMTALQKTVVTATIAVLAGAGIYEARHASQLREQIQTLQEQQADKIQQLSQALEGATNQVAEMSDENVGLNLDSAELLRLRGEVGLLRQLTNDLSGLREENRKLRSGALAQSGLTNQLSAEEQFILRQTHTVDAMGKLLDAVKTFAVENNGKYPDNFDQLISSGAIRNTNFGGDLTLADFEFVNPPVQIRGKVHFLRNRTSVKKPQDRNSIVVDGLIDSNGVPTLEVRNLAPE